MPNTNPTSSIDPTEPSAKDNRESTRSAFQYCQMIAPMFGGRLPSNEEFFEVECSNISTGGMAFFADSPPDFEVLVARLGRPPSVRQLRARVVNVIPVERDGTPVYRVGCRFIDRIIV